MDTTYKNIVGDAGVTGYTGTVICSRPCILSKVVINETKASGVITIYDEAVLATGNNKVATITSPATLLQNQASLDFGEICLKNGLSVHTSGAQNITFSYRPV